MEQMPTNASKSKPKWLIPVILVVGVVFLGLIFIYFSLTRQIKNPKDMRRVSDMRQISLALEFYYEDNGNFPEKLEALQGLREFNLPKDPATQENYAYRIIKNGQAVLIAGRLDDIKNGAFGSDVDGNEFGVDCNDPVYCIIYETESNNEFTDWQTYRNETIGIEFQYPDYYGIPAVEFKDSSLQGQGIMSGKIAGVNFKNADFSISAITEDFQGWMAPYWFNYSKELEDLCVEQFNYEEGGSVCKIVSLNNFRMVFGNSFGAPECSPMFNGYAYINYPNNNKSTYKAIIIPIYYYGVDDILKDYNCDSDANNERMNQELTLFSKSIMERKNLSKANGQNLKELDQILSTFKFIE